MKNKFYTVEKDIGGIHYVAQFNGISAMFRAVDESYVSEDSKNISVEKLSKYIFENVIVEPISKNSTENTIEAVKEEKKEENTEEKLE